MGEKPSSVKLHNGTPYRLPTPSMANSDLSRLINSDEIQSKANAPKTGTAPKVLKTNPLTSASAMAALNPAKATQKKRAAEEQAKAEKAKKPKKSPGKAVRAAQVAFYKSMVASD